MTGGITIRRHVSRGMCALLVIIVAAALIKSFMIDNGSGRVPLGEITELNQQWAKEIKKNAEGTCWEYVYRIPEGLGENLVFSMENSWAALEVFLDGQEIYAFEDIYREHGTAVTGWNFRGILREKSFQYGLRKAKNLWTVL